MGWDLVIVTTLHPFLSIVTLRDRGYTRTWDGIRHMLERVFGADATRESLDAAIAEVYARQKINWRNVRGDADAMRENGADFPRCLRACVRMR